MIAYEKTYNGHSKIYRWHLYGKKLKYNNRVDGFQILYQNNFSSYRVSGVSGYDISLRLVQDLNLKSIKSDYGKVDFI